MCNIRPIRKHSQSPTRLPNPPHRNPTTLPQNPHSQPHPTPPTLPSPLSAYRQRRAGESLQCVQATSPRECLLFLCFYVLFNLFNHFRVSRRRPHANVSLFFYVYLNYLIISLCPGDVNAPTRMPESTSPRECLSFLFCPLPPPSPFF